MRRPRRPEAFEEGEVHGVNLELELQLDDETIEKQIGIKGTIECPSFCDIEAMPTKVVGLLEGVSRRPVRQYATIEYGEKRRGCAVSAVVPEELSEAVVTKIRERLPSGWVAFVGTTGWPEDAGLEGHEVVLAPGESQFDMLRIAGTEPLGGKMGTEALIRFLKELDSALGIRILFAETDAVGFYFDRPPRDRRAFVQRIISLCPNVLDEETPTPEALEKDIFELSFVFMWWD